MARQSRGARESTASRKDRVLATTIKDDNSSRRDQKTPEASLKRGDSNRSLKSDG